MRLFIERNLIFQIFHSLFTSEKAHSYYILDMCIHFTTAKKVLQIHHETTDEFAKTYVAWVSILKQACLLITLFVAIQKYWQYVLKFHQKQFLMHDECLATTFLREEIAWHCVRFYLQYIFASSFCILLRCVILKDQTYSFKTDSVIYISLSRFICVIQIRKIL